MFKKIVFVFLILLGIISLLIANKYLARATAEIQADISEGSVSREPDSAEADCKTADKYYQSQRHQKADELYQRIIDNWPGDEYAMWAQMHLAMSDIRDGNDAAAEKAIDKLLADYSGQKDIAIAVCQIAESYCNSGRYEKACRVFQNAIDKKPQAEHTIWLQMGLAVSSIACGDDAGAQAAVDKLLADFSGSRHIANAICHVADSYRKLGKYEKAEVLYEHIVNNWPDTEHGMWAQMHLAISDIRDGNDAAAEKGIDKLLADYSQNEFISKAVCKLADEYFKLQRHEEADRLYRTAVACGPVTEHAMWSRMHLAMSDIRDGNYPAAETEIDEMLANYPKNELMAIAVYKVADKYCDSRQYEKAERFYQKVFYRWPETENPVWRQMTVAVLKDQLGDETGADDAIAQLCTDFSSHPDLPRAVSRIAMRHHEKVMKLKKENFDRQLARTHLQKAAEVWEMAINKLPDSHILSEAYYFAADCYRRLGKYEGAIGYYQKLLTDWPDYKYNWSAQCLIGCCYEGLRDANSLSESETNAKIEEAYRKVIQNYPDCGVINYASIQLGRMKFDKAQWAEAAEYFEIFLDKCDYDSRVPYVLGKLGQTYEKLGQLEAAIQVYSTFIEDAEPNGRGVESVMLKLKELEAQVK